MLKKFTVKNFKNFKDELLFDLSNTKKFEFNELCVKNGIVNNALIYGPNASGKSNLAFAMFDIISNITDKQKKAEFYSTYLNAENTNALAEFKYDFVFDNNCLEYTYGKKSYEEIVYERIYINGDLLIEYDRRGKNSSNALINLLGAETLNKDISQMKISIVKYIKNNAVLGDTVETRTFNSFLSFVDRMLHFRSLDDRFYQGYDVGVRDIFEEMILSNNTKAFMDFLKKAEIYCNLEIVSINNKKRLVFKFGDNTIDFWENASTGTHSLSLFYYWLQKIKADTNRPSLLFIDEFDAFYHQTVSETLVRELIGNNFQTILTTHNTSLMTNDLLRPDCYYILKNNQINPFSALTDKDIRKAHNIEKMYKAGSFNNE